MRILYVEDNMANVSLVKRVARNHEVINYVDGDEALANFEKDNPDLVLMDIQLSGRLTGLDVVRTLRERGHKLPIIAVTAYAMVGDRERCLAAGCDDYIAKPLPIPTLVALFAKREKELQQKAPEAPTSETPQSTSETKPVTDQPPVAATSRADAESSSSEAPKPTSETKPVTDQPPVAATSGADAESSSSEAPQPTPETNPATATPTDEASITVSPEGVEVSISSISEEAEKTEVDSDKK
ncbi:MAG: hypothetical protein Kow00117_08340 [Phototrophicales bacterium]